VLMLAANRIDSVRGRTDVLIDSIKIKKGLNHVGVLFGRRCARNFLGLWVMLDRRLESHSGILSDSVNIMCLERLSVYGFMPRMLINISKINVDVIIEVIPFRVFVSVRFS